MSQPSHKPQHNVWHAPPNARSEALSALRLSPPSPDEAAALAASAGDWRVRARPYATPVTDETLRQQLSKADAARSTRADDNHRFRVSG